MLGVKILRAKREGFVMWEVGDACWAMEVEKGHLDMSSDIKW